MHILNKFFLFFFIFSLSAPVLWSQWTNLKSDGHCIHSIAIKDTTIFIGNSSTLPDSSLTNGIFRSTNNGINWSTINNGLTCLHITSIAITNESIFAGTTDNGLFRSTNNGETWTNVIGGFYISSIAVSETNVFAATDRGVIFRSSNDFTHWTLLNNGLAGVMIVDLIVSGTKLFAATGLGVFRSTDNGDSWLSDTNEDMRYYIIDSIIMHGTYIFAGGGGKVFRSTDNCASWLNVNNGLPYIITSCFTANKSDLFLGCYMMTPTRGIYLSTDNGQSWSAVSGSPSSDIFSLAVSNEYIFAGSGTGLWREKLSEVTTSTSVDETISLPVQYNLLQNYPNPFNPTTTISFSLPTRSFVSLKVYDLLGKEVATIISEEMPAGNYSKQWNAANASSGIYFYRLQAGSFLETKKLVLLR